MTPTHFHDKKTGQKGSVTQYVITRPTPHKKKRDKKKIIKKEMSVLVNELPEDISEHYLRLMKIEAKMLKKKS